MAVIDNIDFQTSTDVKREQRLGFLGKIKELFRMRLGIEPFSEVVAQWEAQQATRDVTEAQKPEKHRDIFGVGPSTDFQYPQTGNQTPENDGNRQDRRNGNQQHVSELGPDGASENSLKEARLADERIKKQYKSIFSTTATAPEVNNTATAGDTLDQDQVEQSWIADLPEETIYDPSVFATAETVETDPEINFEKLIRSFMVGDEQPRPDKENGYPYMPVDATREVSVIGAVRAGDMLPKTVTEVASVEPELVGVHRAMLASNALPPIDFIDSATIQSSIEQVVLALIDRKRDLLLKPNKTLNAMLDKELSNFVESVDAKVAAGEKVSEIRLLQKSMLMVAEGFSWAAIQGNSEEAIDSLIERYQDLVFYREQYNDSSVYDSVWADALDQVIDTFKDSLSPLRKFAYPRLALEISVSKDRKGKSQTGAKNLSAKVAAAARKREDVKQAQVDHVQESLEQLNDDFAFIEKNLDKLIASHDVLEGREKYQSMRGLIRDAQKVARTATSTQNGAVFTLANRVLNTLAVVANGPTNTPGKRRGLLSTKTFNTSNIMARLEVDVSELRNLSNVKRPEGYFIPADADVEINKLVLTIDRVIGKVHGMANDAVAKIGDTSNGMLARANDAVKQGQDIRETQVVQSIALRN